MSGGTACGWSEINMRYACIGIHSRLPDPRGRPARPHPARIARRFPRLLRHQRRIERTTEAIDLLIEKHRRDAHGFRNFRNYGCDSCSPTD
jgi:hypothetical protein